MSLSRSGRVRGFVRSRQIFVRGGHAFEYTRSNDGSLAPHYWRCRSSECATHVTSSLARKALVRFESFLGQVCVDLAELVREDDIAFVGRLSVLALDFDRLVQ